MYFRETYKGYSPWGGIQHSDVIARGLKAVSTAGHGGYMVTKNFANKYLSDACIKLGEVYGDYLCYEEDCAWAILAYDIVDSFGDRMKEEDVSFEDYKQSLMRTLSYYYPNYLIEKGVTPSINEYNRYLEEQRKDKMRAEKHPDLIVSAVNYDSETVKVWTADGLKHFVNKESYRNLRENSNLLLLSKCIRIEDKFEEVV